MRLRNKRTGQEGNFIINKDHFECTDLEYVPEYRSLDELNADWEDYKPAEPLIKDEKVREAVRAWYDAIDYRIDNLLCIKASGSTRLEISDGSPKLIYISLFVEKGTLDNIKDRTYYTIAELCGEE